ncbi:hypothetical protein K2X30_13885 [bacterium]|jgi:hypothetical protein|nr:hypothetical protein [bacterium]
MKFFVAVTVFLTSLSWSFADTDAQNVRVYEVLCTGKSTIYGGAKIRVEIYKEFPSDPSTTPTLDINQSWADVSETGGTYVAHRLLVFGGPEGGSDWTYRSPEDKGFLLKLGDTIEMNFQFHKSKGPVLVSTKDGGVTDLKCIRFVVARYF